MVELERLFAQAVTADELAQFETYFRLLVEWNERLNLTAITDREGVFGKHFLDSLVVRDLPEWQHCVKTSGRVADVGTGAGFPGLPLAICYPNVQFTLADSLQKRLTFLAEVIEQLGLKNIRLVHGRAEDLARDPKYRNRFDIVMARAVARLNVLLEWTAPFAKVNGHVLSYKGPGVEEELPEAKRAAELLRASVARVELRELPLAIGSRSIVVIRQLATTPKEFPRKAGTASKNPLGVTTSKE